MREGAATQAAIPRRTPQRLSDAQDFIARSYGLSVEAEGVEPHLAQGRILARDVIATVDLPRFDSSAVDGYAVRSADLPLEGTGKLRLVGLSAAGHPSDRPLKPGEAMRIYTGATVPHGADRVVMQEDCGIVDGMLMVPGCGSKRNIRHAGEDVAIGSAAIRKGTRIGAGHLALAAALGCVTLPIYRRLKVALFSTGDEVGPPRISLAAGQIADANRPMLRSLLSCLGCDVEDGGILRDDAEAQIAALTKAARDHDLIITTGGMSVGDEDHLTRVIRRRGYLEMWRLKIKPGKPVGIGDIDDCPILALPGNPVAAAFTFLTLGAPLISRLAGSTDPQPATLRLPLSTDIEKRPGRTEALAARLVLHSSGCTSVEPLAKTGSAMLSSLAGADGFIVLPDDAGLKRRGEPVDFILLPRE